MKLTTIQLKILFGLYQPPEEHQKYFHYNIISSTFYYRWRSQIPCLVTELQIKGLIDMEVRLPPNESIIFTLSEQGKLFLEQLLEKEI